MAKTRTTQSSLSGGELAPELHFRPDIPRYHIGAAKIRNFIPKATGGAVKAPGTIHVCTPPSGNFRLLDCDLVDQGELVGFGIVATAGKFRFTRNGVEILAEGGDPYEIETPYSAEDLERLNWSYNRKVLYLVHPDFPPQQLRRVTDTEWTLAPVAFKYMPLMRPADTELVTLKPSARTGPITITANHDFFLAGHVGTVFMINNGLAKVSEVTDPQHAEADIVAPIVQVNNVSKFTDTVTVTIDQAALPAGVSTLEVKSVGATDKVNLEVRLEMASPSAITPEPLPAGIVSMITVRTQGVGSEREEYNDTTTITIDKAALAAGVTTITWHSMLTKKTGPDYFQTWSGIFGSGAAADVFTYGLTTTFGTKPAGVTATVSQVATRLDGTEEDEKWKEYAWSDARGWPWSIAFHDQRMILAGNYEYPTTVWGSVINQPTNFLLGPDDDAAYGFTPAAANTPIHHLAATDVVIGFTNNRETVLAPSGEKPITPDSVSIKTRTAYGSSRRVRPIIATNQVFFSTASGLRLRMMQYRIEQDGFQAPDVSVMANHLLESGEGIKDMVHLPEPYSCFYIVTNRGSLLTFTYDEEQQTLAWAKHATATPTDEAQEGDEVTEYVTITSTAGDKGTRREILIGCRRLVGGEYVNLVEKVAPGVFTHCSVQGEDAEGKATWDGLDHLEGKEVTAWADGFAVHGLPVQGGQVILPGPAKKTVIGLRYKGTIVDLPPVIQMQTGTTLGANMAVNSIQVAMLDSIGVKLNGEAVGVQTLGAAFNAPPRPVTGLQKVGTLGWGTESQGQVLIEADEPYQVQILAICKEVSIND